MEEYVEKVSLEAVDRRHAGSWDTIHQVVNSQLWERQQVTLNLGSQGEMCSGGQSEGRCTTTWSYMQRSTCDHEDRREDIQCRVAAVIGVCCAQCILHTGYALLRVTGVFMSWKSIEHILGLSTAAYLNCSPSRFVVFPKTQPHTLLVKADQSASSVGTRSLENPSKFNNPGVLYLCTWKATPSIRAEYRRICEMWVEPHLF